MKNSQIGNGYKTTGQTAEILGVTRQAVNQMIQEGRLHAIWMLEQWAIHDAEVERVRKQREDEVAAA